MNDVIATPVKAIIAFVGLPGQPEFQIRDCRDSLIAVCANDDIAARIARLINQAA